MGLQQNMEIERRYIKTGELRVEGDSNPKITGYAAVFNKWADIGGMFRENIAPGAFAKTINEADVRGLWNHDVNFVLGRNKAGTLRLEEDKKGLKTEIDPPDTSWANDLTVSMRRGDVNQMSFGFVPIKTSDNIEKNERTLLEVRLFDVSIVTFPAYPQTSAKVRSLYGAIENKAEPAEEEKRAERLEQLYEKLKRGDELNEEDQELLRSFLPEPRETHSNPAEPPEKHSEGEQARDKTAELIAAVDAMVPLHMRTP